ncbi:MAG: hypothetical protein WA989_11600 [Henriciella sp.]|uniref:fimbrial biogenesis chaperone n=1 Tax=Henriciella sp. TaxID=1968823 RepID=UPI003C75E1AE
MIPKTLARSCLMALLACGLGAPAALGFEVGLQPTTVEMSADPGNRQRQVISISNSDSDAPISLTIGLADWTLARDGQIRLSPPGEREESASDWVRFSPSFVTLEPGESQKILVDIIAPAKLARTGDYRFAVLASTILPDRQGGQSGILKKYEIASLFYLTTDRAMSHPAVRDVRLSVAADGRQTLKLMVENSGNAHARLNGDVLIEGKGERIEIPISNLVVLENSEREFDVPFEGPLPANPSVTVSFENVFAPQGSGGTQPVKTYTAPLSVTGAPRLSASIQ